MPESHVDLVRTAFENAARVRDPSGERFDVLDVESREVIFGFVHEELEFREDPKFPEGGVYRGADAARAYFEQFTESFDEFVLENPEFLRVDDERVLVQFRLQMRGKGSGAPAEAFPGWVWTIREGRAVKIEAFLDRAEARAAAGLD
jgi:ketosteroid isomerase-like protein